MFSHDIEKYELLCNLSVFKPIGLLISIPLSLYWNIESGVYRGSLYVNLFGV